MSNSTITETRQYLTFKLENEIFALDVCQVREILDQTPITKVPQTPDFMRGVINLRGSVVPVVDIKLKFGIGKTEQTVDTCIIVAEINLEEETAIIGILVDSVEEVFELDPGQIEPSPRIGTRLNAEFIKGMGKRDGKFIMILDIDKVFSENELVSLQGLEAENKLIEGAAA